MFCFRISIPTRAAFAIAAPKHRLCNHSDDHAHKHIAAEHFHPGKEPTCGRRDQISVAGSCPRHDRKVDELARVRDGLIAREQP